MIVCIGAMIGSYFLGDIANNFGRRKAMITFDIVMMLGCAIMNINNYVIMMIGRFVAGLAVGGNNALIPLYVNEISPIEVSGKMGSIFQFFVCFSYFIAFSFGILLLFFVL